MRTPALIEGLTILQKYMDDMDDWNCGAEHETVYFYPTDRPVEQPDLDRLVELGWIQEDTDFGDDEETEGNFGAKHYDPEESWQAKL